MHQLISYIEFLINSTNQHGVHSPFVYGFVTKCLYDKTKYEDYKVLKEFQKILLHAENKTTVILPKQAKYSFKKIKIIYRLSRYFNFENTLQLGDTIGLQMYALAINNQKNKIIAIEESKSIFEFAKNFFLDLNLLNVTSINSEIEDGIQNIEDTQFDAIIFNSIPKNKLLSTFNSLKSKAHNNSIFVFDAIHSSKDTTAIWEKIISDSRITVSVDCFNLGFVFFRKEQPKQHFRIRL